MSDACLLVFSKPARPGRVKTRLIRETGLDANPGLTPEQAAALHQAFLDDLTERLSPGAFDLVLAWALEEGEAHPRTDLPSIRQRGADLGERLFRSLAEAAETHALVGAVGSDHPELALEAIEDGFARLRSGVEVVLGPTDDGGYYFIGARAGSLRRELFERIGWSTGTVLAATLERCRELSLRVGLLETGSDVDTPADLEGLLRRIEESSGRHLSERVVSPRTERLLREWGLVATQEWDSGARPMRPVVKAGL